MDTEFLEDREREVVAELIAKRNFCNEEWITFLDNNSVQLDGDFTMDDIKFLFDCMKRIKNTPEDKGKRRNSNQQLKSKIAKSVEMLNELREKCVVMCVACIDEPTCINEELESIVSQLSDV